MTPETKTPTNMNISKYDKAEVLAALYNGSRAQGMGFLSAKNEQITKDEAAEILKTQTDFDYLYGRVMKIDLSGDELMTHLYNRYNGGNAAETIIGRLNPLPS